jgi:pyruvate,water dikinase
MAVLAQRVSGRVFRNFFFPALAGVAFSRNLYVWTNRIDPRQGVIRLVFGLGTRAVDRVGYDYPRMIPVSHPRLRPEVGMKVVKYSQRQLDLIDLRANRFGTGHFGRWSPTPTIPTFTCWSLSLRREDCMTLSGGMYRVRMGISF